MTGGEHPCVGGLTEECFKKYPKWARQMFAYRLLLTLCPHEITKRLPELKGLFPLLVPPDWPPGEVWTPGISIDPGVVFPEGWTPDDPLPAGVTISPGAVFPPGWTPGDPVPAGVTISSSAVFPPGWIPGDPMPAGVIVGRRQRPAVLGSGAIPPYYIQVWEPGPAHRPADTPPEVVADGWESWSGPNIDSNHPWYCLGGFCVCGAPTIVAGHLEFTCDNPEPLASKGNIVIWNYSTDPNPPPAGKLTLQIQIEASVSSTNDWGAVYMPIRDLTEGVVKYFIFAYGSSYGLGADDVDVGDNGGAPMEIDLSSYGILSVDRMSIEANIAALYYSGHAEYKINYINFD